MSGNALAETALALAMAFFGVMVLALVSMGSAATGPAVTAVAVDGAGGAERVERQLLVHFEGRFLDHHLAPLKIAALAAGPLTLAVDPATPLADLVALRAQVARPDLAIVPLNEVWLRRLEELNP